MKNTKAARRDRKRAGQSTHDRHAPALRQFSEESAATGPLAGTLPEAPRASAAQVREWFTLALQRFSSGALEAADEALAELLEAAPRHPEALELSAIVAAQRGDPAEAIRRFRRLAAVQPDSAEAQFNLGNLYRHSLRWEEAEAAYRAALRIAPAVPQAVFSLGLVLGETGRPHEAEAEFRRALALDPGYVEAMYNLGVVLAGDGRPMEAEALYRKVLELSPRFHFARNNLGCLWRDAGRLDEAEAAFRRAADDGQIDALHNLAALLRDTGRIEESEATFAELIRVAPDSHLALNCRGVLLLKSGCYDEGADAFERALHFKPDFVEARYNLSLIQLARGDFGQGWANYELRWQSAIKAFRRNFPQALWEGESFQGRTLLLHCEQGAGDNLQFIRYLPGAVERGGRVILECPDSLYRLFQGLPGIAQVVRAGEPLPDFDVHCPLMSLPRVFRTLVNTIPADVPYLVPPAEALAAMPGIETRPDAPFKVGLAWAGNPRHANDGNRSVDFALLQPLWDVPGVAWVILQKDRRPEGVEEMAMQNGWVDPMASAKDFADTAALILQLDLVIGVDTSVIHLAGALGKPVWALISASHDWRWLFGREDSPWYPTMRLFRQHGINDWPEVIDRVSEELAIEVLRFKKVTHR